MTSLTISGGDIEPRFSPAAASVDTVRALCHDLRQPLTAIMLLAATEGGDARRRLETILAQARWLTDLVDEVLVGAAADRPSDVDVTEVVWDCVRRARPTAGCQVDFVGEQGAMAHAPPVALGRAVGCIVDNAVRAAGNGGSVVVSVTAGEAEVVITVEDDGPGLGHVSAEHSLGLPITRALVAACAGSFALSAGRPRGMVATIRLATVSHGSVAS